jgi:Ala-tRNA(Pro) deacylase
MVDLHEVRATLGFAQIRLATEDELGRIFPDCEVGAMPALGPVYNIPVFLDEMLAGRETFAFNGGTHRDEVHMTIAEFRRLAKPRILSLTREPAAAHGW